MSIFGRCVSGAAAVVMSASSAFADTAVLIVDMDDSRSGAATAIVPVANEEQCLAVGKGAVAKGSPAYNRRRITLSCISDSGVKNFSCGLDKNEMRICAPQ